jgi:alpha-glucosidase
MTTVWDEKKVLKGKIGECATIDRRTDDEWFLGSLTDENYEATIYTHNEKSPSSTNVGIENREVISETQLNFEVAANSGLAIHFQVK